MRDDNAWCVEDPVIEWTGRADGIEDAQFSFSDIRKDDQDFLIDAAARKAEAKAKERL